MTNKAHDHGKWNPQYIENKQYIGVEDNYCVGYGMKEGRGIRFRRLTNDFEDLSLCGKRGEGTYEGFICSKNSLTV